MLHRFVRSRTPTLGVSCLLHLALIAAVLGAERWAMSAHASRLPALPIALVTPAEPPRPEPATPVPPPRIPPRDVRLPKPIRTPLPSPSAERPEPQPVQPAPEPPPPAPSIAPPAPRAASPPAAAATPSAVEPAPAAVAPQNPRALAATAPERSTQPARPTGAPGQPLAATRPEPGAIGGDSTAPGQPAIATAPSRETGSTGAITRYARPQGGYQVRPSYPPTARWLGVQGTTVLRVHVLIDGRVGDVVVQETAGHPDLDQAAADAVRRWKFEPARKGDDPVAMWVLLPVEFRLK